jgi:hypothetical protein
MSGLTISCQHFGQGPCNPDAAPGTVSVTPQAGQSKRMDGIAAPEVTAGG